MTAPPTARPVDTSGMNTIHTLFRREFRLAGGLARGVPEGDEARAAVVVAHLRLVCQVLHHHHTTEDELLWPLLVERVPEELAPLVHLMERQHAEVERLLAEIGDLLPRFASRADAADGERLGDLFDTLYVHLVEHLDDEEQRLLPLVARTVTQAEWDALGAAGRAGAPPGRSLLILGMFQYDAEPDAFARMLAGAPAPVRFLLPRLARRAFRRHSRRVHGTTSP